MPLDNNYRPMNKDDVDSDAIGIVFAYFVIALILAAIFTGIYLGANSTNKKHRQQHFEQVERNKIWETIATDKQVVDENSPGWKLATDLLRVEEISEGDQDNPLLPNSVNNVIVDYDRYPGLRDQVGCILGNDDDPVYKCPDAGHLKPSVLNSFLLARSGEYDLAYVLPREYKTSVNLHVIPVTIVIYTIVNLFYLVLLTRPTSDKLIERGSLKTIGFAFLFIFAPLGSLRWISWAYEVRKEGKAEERKAAEKAERERQAAEERIRNHPLRQELVKAERAQAELAELLRQHPKNRDLITAKKEVDAVVAELREFPTVYSENTAKYIANDLLQEVRTSKSAMANTLKARSEIETLP